MTPDIVDISSTKTDPNVMAGEAPPSSHRLFPSVRIFIVILEFFAISAIFSSIVSFNFAIVCMVKSENGSAANSTNDGDFVQWTRTQQASAMAAGTWSISVTALASGWLADRYGAKWIFLLLMFVNSIAIAFTPLAAFQGIAWVCVARVLVGAAVGGSIPCLTVATTRWSLPHERATSMAAVLAGMYFGQIPAMSISGVLCESSAGWPSIFYLWASVSGLVTLLWFVFYTDDPSASRFISAKEREALKLSNQVTKGSNSEKSITVPWRHIIFSKPTLAIYVCHFCADWGVDFMALFVPTYCKEILGLDLASSGFYSALPGLCQTVGVFLFGALAEKITCKCVSPTVSVKIFNTLGTGVPACGMLVLSFLTKDSGALVTITFFCLCSFFYVAWSGGFLRSILLIAPKYCGTVSAVSYFCAETAAIIVPYVVGAIRKQGTISEWHTAFYIAMALSAFACVEFVIFGSGQQQRWANPDMETMNEPPVAVTVASEHLTSTESVHF